MKRITTLLLIITFVHTALADVIQIDQNYFYTGTVLKSTKKSLKFKSDSGETYKIPMSRISSIEFENSESELAKEFEKNTKIFMEDFQMTSNEKKLQANLDSKHYGKTVGYVSAGFFLGPFGYLFLIGSDKFEPTNASHPDKVANQNLINDYEYINYYSKKARSRKAWDVTIGFVVSMILFSAISG